MGTTGKRLLQQFSAGHRHALYNWNVTILISENTSGLPPGINQHVLGGTPTPNPIPDTNPNPQPSIRILTRIGP